MRYAIGFLLVFFVVGCGKNGGGGGGVMGVTPISVVVSYSAGGTIFIGATVQFQAQEMLSNGTMQTSTSAAWASDNPAVATVSGTGVVTAVAAGQATISASVNNVPGGFLLIRVFPNFGGMWTGNEVIAGCTETGDWAVLALCELFSVGDPFPHRSMFTQSDASVGAEVNPSGDQLARATTSGTISVGGELTLLPALYLPGDPMLDVRLENWRSRSDIPSRMTGTFDAVFTSPGVSGEVRLQFNLENVVRTDSGAAFESLPREKVSRPSAVERLLTAMGRRQ